MLTGCQAPSAGYLVPGIKEHSYGCCWSGHAQWKLEDGGWIWGKLKGEMLG